MLMATLVDSGDMRVMAGHQGCTGNFLFIVCSFALFEFYSTHRNYLKLEFHYTNLPSW
jgi:hypothetical protein